MLLFAFSPLCYGEIRLVSLLQHVPDCITFWYLMSLFLLAVKVLPLYERLFRVGLRPAAVHQCIYDALLSTR